MNTKTELIIKPLIDMIKELDYTPLFYEQNIDRMVFRKIITFDKIINENTLEKETELTIPIIEKPIQLLKKHGIILDTETHFYKRTNKNQITTKYEFFIQIIIIENIKTIRIEQWLHNSKENKKNEKIILLTNNSEEMKKDYRNILDTFENNNMNLTKKLEEQFEQTVKKELEIITQNNEEYNQILNQNKALNYLIGALYQYEALQKENN